MNKIPQRRPNKTMSGFQLLSKAMTGSHKLKTPNEKKQDEIKRILDGKPKK